MSTEPMVEEVSVNDPKGESITVTPDMLKMLQMILQQNSASTLEAIREMKKPSEEEQAKLDEEKKRSMELTLRRIEAARRQEAKDETAWRSCAHVLKNGKTAFRGQGLSNGYAQAFCPKCHYLSKPFMLAAHEMTGGLNISEWSGDVFGVIQRRVNNSPPPGPIPELPSGAAIEWTSN